MKIKEEIMRARVRIEYQRWVCMPLPKSAAKHRKEYAHYLEGLIGNEDKIIEAYNRGERYEDQQAGSERF